jgi:hypothetical protein
VNWFVLTEGLPGMACPYKNRAVAVCRLP